MCSQTVTTVVRTTMTLSRDIASLSEWQYWRDCVSARYDVLSANKIGTTPLPSYCVYDWFTVLMFPIEIKIEDDKSLWDMTIFSKFFFDQNNWSSKKPAYFPHVTPEGCGPGSSVGIATDYGLDVPGSNPGDDQIFPPSRPAVGPTQPPVQWPDRKFWQTSEVVYGLAITDTWQGNPTRKVYIHYSASRATRIGRIYATRELLERKLGVEAIAAPFTAHLAVCLRISIDLPIMRWGRGLWKLDSVVITENPSTEKLRTLWGRLNDRKGPLQTS